MNAILDRPFIWNLSQSIFGCDAHKRQLYRSVFPMTGRLLDFGCACGNLFPAFKDFEYYGLDKNERLIKYARKKYRAFKNAHFIHADILDRPFPLGFFDFVLFACTGHHIEDRALLEIMDALAKLLRDDGSIFYFDTIRRPGMDSRLLRFLISLDQGKCMRDEAAYQSMVPFNTQLQAVQTRILQITHTLMPQPTYFYAQLRKL